MSKAVSVFCILLFSLLANSQLVDEVDVMNYEDHPHGWMLRIYGQYVDGTYVFIGDSLVPFPVLYKLSHCDLSVLDVSKKNLWNLHSLNGLTHLFHYVNFSFHTILNSSWGYDPSGTTMEFMHPLALIPNTGISCEIDVSINLNGTILIPTDGVNGACKYDISPSQFEDDIEIIIGFRILKTLFEGDLFQQLDFSKLVSFANTYESAGAFRIPTPSIYTPDISLDAIYHLRPRGLLDLASGFFQCSDPASQSCNPSFVCSWHGVLCTINEPNNGEKSTIVTICMENDEYYPFLGEEIILDGNGLNDVKVLSLSRNKDPPSKIIFTECTLANCFSKLQALSINNIPLTDSYLPSFTSASFSYLFASNCSLSGLNYIPQSILSVDLSYNHFGIQEFRLLWSLPLLRSLNLAGNFLGFSLYDFTLPRSELKTLIYLNLSKTSMYGNFAEIQNSIIWDRLNYNWEVLVLSNNYIFGPISTVFRNSPLFCEGSSTEKTRVLDISSNSFYGTYSSALCSFGLVQMYVNFNPLKCSDALFNEIESDCIHWQPADHNVVDFDVSLFSRTDNLVLGYSSQISASSLYRSHEFALLIDGTLKYLPWVTSKNVTNSSYILMNFWGNNLESSAFSTFNEFLVSAYSYDPSNISSIFLLSIFRGCSDYNNNTGCSAMLMREFVYPINLNFLCSSTETLSPNKECKCSKGYYISNNTNCLLCQEGSYSDEIHSLSCKTCPILTNNRIPIDLNGTLYVRDSLSTCLCMEGYYGTAAKGCKLCPKGAFCPGAEDYPRPQAGYFRFLDDPETFYKCFPSSACVNISDLTVENNCALGYEGPVCNQCSTGFTRVNHTCEKCSNFFVGSFVFFCVFLFIAVLFLIADGAPHSIKFHTIGIVISWLQIISLFLKLPINWPNSVLFVFNLFTLFNLNLDILRFGCVFGSSYWIRYFIWMFLPLIFGGIFFGLHLLHKRLVRKYPQLQALFTISWHELLAFKLSASLSDRRDPFMHSRYLYAFILFISTFYASIASTSTEPFSCISIGNGVYVMTQAPHIQCYSKEWNLFLPVSIIGLLIYLFLLPFSIAFILYRYRNDLYKESFLKHYGCLTFPYRPEFYYGEVLFLMKDAIVIIIIDLSINFNQFKNIQSFFLIIFLFFCLIIQVVFKPFVFPINNYLSFTWISSSMLFMFCGIVFNVSNSSAERVVFSTLLIAYACFSIGVSIYATTQERSYNQFFTEYEKKYNLGNWQIRERQRLKVLSTFPRSGKSVWTQIAYDDFDLVEGFMKDVLDEEDIDMHDAKTGKATMENANPLFSGTKKTLDKIGVAKKVRSESKTKLKVQAPNPLKYLAYIKYELGVENNTLTGVSISDWTVPVALDSSEENVFFKSGNENVDSLLSKLDQVLVGAPILPEVTNLSVGEDYAEAPPPPDIELMTNTDIPFKPSSTTDDTDIVPLPTPLEENDLTDTPRFEISGTALLDNLSSALNETLSGAEPLNEDNSHEVRNIPVMESCVDIDIDDPEADNTKYSLQHQNSFET